MTLYEKTGLLCKQKGINISNLGDAIGIKIDKSTISHWKKGATPRASTLKAIADFFGVTVDLLTDESAPVEIAFNTANNNTVNSDFTEQQKALIDMFNRMNVVQQAQLLAYAAELLK